MPAILMIDDDADFCGLASAQFAKMGYTVALAHKGKEGLAKWRPCLSLADAETK